MSGSVWTAVSPCTAACVTVDLPQAGAGRAMTVRRYAAFLTTLAGAAAAGKRLGEAEELRLRARSLLADLGISLECEAEGLAVPVPGARTGTLVVANHTSWLDVIALLAVQPAVPLAKREVGQWPVVGTLVRRAGTRFIDREGLRGLPDTVRELGALLRSGESVIVFPEGTTWCSAPGGPFRRATFQAALDAGAPVRPVTLTYACHGAPTTLPAYVGEGTFGGSLRRVAAARGLSVRVTAHPVLHPWGHNRRSLAALAQAAVSGTRETAPAPTPRPLAHAMPGHGQGPRAETPAPAAAHEARAPRSRRPAQLVRTAEGMGAVRTRHGVGEARAVADIVDEEEDDAGLGRDEQWCRMSRPRSAPVPHTRAGQGSTGASSRKPPD